MSTADPARDRSPVTIGTRRELFVDSLLIEALKGATLQMHAPQPREVVLQHNTPWEGPFSLYHTVIRDGDRYLLYYRGWRLPEEPAVYCMAESGDGIHFERPELDRHAWQGSKRNNIFFAEEPFTHTFAPFLDDRPGVAREHRFKALARDFHGERTTRNSVLNAFVSADGIDWQRWGNEPVLTDGAFDSQNVSFWSQAEGKYVAYYRTFIDKDAFASGTTGATTRVRRIRAIMRATSDDFRTWEPGVLMDYRTGERPAPVEEFYINQTRPYFRAPHIYVALPARFMDRRPAISAEEAAAIGVHATQLAACSDACFMTARPGNNWYDRTFMEAFVRPRIGASHWSARCNYPVDGVVQTGPDEMSIYIAEHYAQPGNQVRRYSMRLDGFSSVHTTHGGGELLSKPLVFSGQELELNFATSAAGSMRVEIRDAAGKSIPGYSLREAIDVPGNSITGRARWKNGTTVGSLAGRPVQLRFVMRDADLYSMRFVGAE